MSHVALMYLILLQLTIEKMCNWGRVTHICVGKLTIIGSDNGLSPGRRQAIIWTNAGILLIGPLGTNFSETLIAMEAFSFKKMHLKKSSAKWRPFCLGPNVLTGITITNMPRLCITGPLCWESTGTRWAPYRGYPTKRTLSAMRKHGG